MTAIRPIKWIDETVGWALTAEYDHPAQAHKAWEAMATLARTRNLGVTRHGIEASPGSHDTDAAIYVSAVSEHRDAMDVAERVLIDQRGGRPHELDPALDRALLARRLEVVAAAGPQKSGRVMIRRPERRGARLEADGTMREAPPGKG